MKWLWAGLFVLLVSCSSQRMIETNLYFGLSKPTGGMVTEKEWTDFRDNYISKIFKEGSTVISTAGSWYDPESHKLINEPGYQVSYLYKKAGTISKQIDSLRYWYKKLFQQQSVLRVDKKVRASF
jgi:hypothetical protein